MIICPEIHSPTPIKHEVVDEYVEFIERTGTKHFGILIDTGIFQDRPDPAANRVNCPVRAPRSWTASASTPPTSPTSPSTSCSSRRSSTTSTRTLEDQQIPWEPVLRAIRDAGYTGYLSSEYEGEREPWRSIEQVRRQHSLMRQVADAL